MLKLISFLIIFTSIFSCAQITSLNLQKHQFGQIPTKIIWIQVAGLNEEHIAMLKFSKQTSGQKTSFEKFLCVGKAWEYNLFKIRPSAKSSFLSQITGKKNIKNSCEDYTQKPIWSYMTPQGYKVGVFEGQMSKKNSLESANECKNDKTDFIKGITLWKMQKGEKKNKLFHVNETRDYKDNIYYDKSCLSGDCYSTFSQNVIGVYEQFTRKDPNHLFIVRDFDFKRNLDKKDIASVKANLIELEKITQYFQNLTQNSTDVLVLLTSAQTKNVEFPRYGNEWKTFEKTGKLIQNKKSQLISTVFASGARAENFCGIYDQSDILTRIFSGAKQQGLELAIINPFEQ